MTAPQPGDVYHFPDYVFPDGETRDKLVVLLALTRADDWVLARTTSRQHGRPADPPCYHGYPYSGFYLHRADGVLRLPSWVPLDRFDPADAQEFGRYVAENRVTRKGRLQIPLFIALLECCAQVEDLQRMQEEAIRDVLGGLR